ncbi:MAG: glycogen debranching protein GlgX [Acidobacteriota bacterium]|nr:glycogen debranching protein GlgX [Acidobacteriota bacterium]
MKFRPGKPHPLGATRDGRGVNFSIFSERAEKVELCLFDGPDATREEARIALPERTDFVWHGYMPDIRPGQLYGYRLSGPYDPRAGHRFNPAKVVLDPYAKGIGRTLRWDDAVYGGDLKADPRDSAPFAPLAAVLDPAFEWGDDAPPRTPWHETVIYEVHVKGFTARHPDLPPHLRGTYLGLASDAAVRHFTDLGITAVELLPVHQAASERRLVRAGLTNYWGYNTLACFAPDVRFATSPGRAVEEFKTMVRRLHAAGIEVILDVVYNHTAEGGRDGPTLSLRGIDNRSYYRLRPDEPAEYVDFTGCGNTLDAAHPRVLQLIVDSLRYWVLEMHVDGFRFDLAVALARGGGEFDRGGVFLQALRRDPVLSRVKLIAEPWDLGPGGHQTGNFPAPWAEWNDRYRDTVRRFWRGDAGEVPALATRLAGSSDLYAGGGRPPSAGINFVTAHDGFTLDDLVSYEKKRNEANREANRDGAHDNLSWNCGVEGTASDAEIRALRARQKRNFLATLLLSQGVPMICGGDELGRTQRGNNNAYCQDNETSWFDWDLAPADRDLPAFVRRLIRFRRDHPVLRRRRFLRGTAAGSGGNGDVAWFGPDGREMTDEAWNRMPAKCLGMRLAGEAMDETDERGRRFVDDTLLILFNADDREAPFTLPGIGIGGDRGAAWTRVLDTMEAPAGATPDTGRPGASATGTRVGDVYALPARSLAVFLASRARAVPAHSPRVTTDHR